MYVTPLPRDFRERTCLAPSKRHAVRPVGTALAATQAAEGRAQRVTRPRRGNACRAVWASVPKLSNYSSPGLPIPGRFQTQLGCQKWKLPDI
ncbi:hypothetical protein A6R68_18443, partial [Neotoma lepida]